MSEAEPDVQSESTSVDARALIQIHWLKFAEAFALVAAIILLGAVFGALSPQAFLSWANISAMLGSQGVLVILTLALIIPLTAGDFDLSVASILTLSAMLIAVLNVQQHWSLTDRWQHSAGFAQPPHHGGIERGHVIHKQPRAGSRPWSGPRQWPAAISALARYAAALASSSSTKM